jgi:hypothetical protein
MTENGPALKDAAVAILGAYAALAGVVLVLIGFLYLQAGTFTGDINVANKYRNVGKFGLLPFVMCNVVVWSSLLDLMRTPPAMSSFSYVAAGATLLSLTVYGLVTFLIYLRR